MVPGLDVLLPKQVSNLIGIFHLWRDAESCWTREGGHASHIRAFVDEEILVKLFFVADQSLVFLGYDPQI